VKPASRKKGLVGEIPDRRHGLDEVLSGMRGAAAVANSQ
jgi:hypothetical protein